MSDKDLPSRPNLEYYRKQSKELLAAAAAGSVEAISRILRHHPRFHTLGSPDTVKLSHAQLVIAREHGFESWPKFAEYIRTLELIQSVSKLPDPIPAFLTVACVPRHSSHASGTLEHAQVILERYPEVARSNIYTAAVLGDLETVRLFLASDPSGATVNGGVYGWDALTYLCFSRYLRLDRQKSEAFVATAKLLLDAGANANTGWYETIDQPTPRLTFESVLYGAAGIAGHPELTRLLVERGADPNDEETPYHVPESYDNTIMRILLESGRLKELSLACMLVRKADWHDMDGLKLLLAYNANPNIQPSFGVNALQQSIRRDNSLAMITLLLDRGGDPNTRSNYDGRSAAQTAARRGRVDVLELLDIRGDQLSFGPMDTLVVHCARCNRARVNELLNTEPDLRSSLQAEGGALLAEFAGNGNVEGLRCLLDVGIPVGALYGGDGYFEIAPQSTALHVAAWRAQPNAVVLLLERGASVHVKDAKGRTPLQLAVKGCVDSYWMNRRTPASVAALLNAGASPTGINVPTGYSEIDRLLAPLKQA